MDKKSSFQLKVENMLARYINRFLRYAKFSHISAYRKELIAGTFHYLLEEQDIVPDNVPNIGYLDDLMVFTGAAKLFTQDDQTIPGVTNPSELARDTAFVNKHKSLIFGSQALSMEIIRKKGKKVEDLALLCEQIREKYAELGSIES